MNPIIQRVFNKGLVTKIEDRDAVRGSASDCLNWHFLGDHIELRRGRKLLGSEISGVGRVTGLRVAKRFDGVDFVFFSFARKLYYYDVETDTATEISSNALPADVLDDAGLGEDISLEQYNSPAGNYVYISSPNSGMYKIPIANPGSIVDLLQREYRGKIRIKNSRMLLWDRKDTFGGNDKTGIYGSYIDQNTDAYSFTSSEDLGTGDGVTTTFSGTLAFKATNSKETCFLPVIAGAKAVATSISAITQATQAQITSASHGLSVGDTVVFDSISGMTQLNGRIAVVLTVPSSSTFTINIDSTSFSAYTSGGNASKAERFIDDKSGNLVGQDGGTGTINYATGAFSITFNAAVISGKKVYGEYYREDATVHGIADFSFSGTRLAGEGFVFRQDDGGGYLMNVETLGPAEYCLHEFKSWALTIGALDDTDTTNQIYRDNVGIPYFRSSKATGDGIFYVDIVGDDPTIRVLNFGKFVNEVLPQSVSEHLDLRNYEFDKAVMFEWGDYIVLSCRSNTSTTNNRLFMYNKVWKSWEIHSFSTSCLDILSGALIAGDASSNNIFKLFSGLTDEEALIENYINLTSDNLNKEGTKTLNIMRIAGYIGIDQEMKVSYSVDNEPFVEITKKDGSSPLIQGDGSEVDLSQRKLIGSTTLGEELIGGGQDAENAIYASPYHLEFFVGTRKFERITVRLEATGIGYLSVSEYGFVDVRDKGLRLPPKYVDSI